MKTVYLIIGTRPDTIKMAPIYHALRTRSGLNVKLISTGQHKELLASALNSFKLRPDIDLGLMRHSQSLSTLTADILHGMQTIFAKEKPDLVLTHGDTTTCYASALACFYQRIPFYHVEAGLRSRNILSPYPEEFHRQSTSIIADHHFAPTLLEKQNLILDGVHEAKITVTGSTIHEAIQSIDYLNDSNFEAYRTEQFTKMVTVTMHRRESGAGYLQNIMQAIKNIALLEKKCVFVFPVHPSPLVKKVSGEVFHGVENVVLTNPMDYTKFISLLTQSDLILTDSGGVQEEAAFLGRNVFILRDHIERFDGVKQGLTKVLGLNAKTIENEVLNYLRTKPTTKHYSPVKNPSTKTPSAIIADYIVGKQT
jgi:UDP-N-acetylglucosamine 2-epimerase (non-hydrolysing)